MVFAFRVAFLLLSVSLCAAVAGAGEPAKPLQTVLISFDGAHALSQWERSRALSRKTGARFTYFLSCAYLLSDQTRHYYRGNGKKQGKSNVGFAKTRDEVAGRLRQIWAARREGHEMASHGCGHFDGKSWTKTQWRAEHNAFSTILKDAWSLNGIPYEPGGWTTFAKSEIVGFRAPYLSTNRAMFDALSAQGFRYDASDVSRGPTTSSKHNGLFHIPLPTIPEGPRGRRIIAMDYNLFVRHSAGLERPSEADVFADRTYDALMAAFKREHTGKRRPLSIGFHFTLMNGGAYWNALERFASDVCDMPDVACVSHHDYVRTLEAKTLGG